MKEISLLQVRLADFRSFVKPTQITLSGGHGLKLITGENQIEPRLGGNGCGKSTLWDAVSFALYGTSIKGLRASDLVSYGKTATAVEIDLQIGNARTTVKRTAPPMRIWIDDQPAEQPDVERLVGLTAERFRHSVIFGQAVPLFIDLSVPKRGDLLDDVLGLQLWLIAADKASAEAKELGSQLNELRQEIARAKGQLDGIGDVQRWARAALGWESTRQARLAVLSSELENAKADYHALKTRLATELEFVDETAAKEAYDRSQQLNGNAREKMAAVQAELKQLADDEAFLADNDTCPVCNQPITQTHKDEHYRRIAPRLDQLEQLGTVAQMDIVTTAAEVEAWQVTWRSAIRQNQEKRANRTVLHGEARSKEAEIQRLTAEADRLTQEANPHTAAYHEAMAEQARLLNLLAALRRDDETLTSHLTALDFWRQGFRRVRLFCLERVLQELKLETRNSMLALGLAGWNVDFKTATETKSGTLRLGVQVEVQSPSAVSKFENLSGGEGQRARLAVSLGLANLIQRWAGVRFDFEVFDEPTAWLSEPGVEDLLESLQTRADAFSRSIWVCDHRAHIYSGFKEILRIIKGQDGSYVH